VDVTTWGDSVKILIAGARYTGKGQVGRAWGQTTADVPTLQPVLLYDRNIEFRGNPTRVVAWVLSFDPEFESLRRHFYPGGDGLILTFNLLDPEGKSLDKLNGYLNEIQEEMGTVPPHILVGVRLNAGGEKSPTLADLIDEWRSKHDDPPYFEADYTDSDLFSQMVDQAFTSLLSLLGI